MSDPEPGNTGEDDGKPLLQTVRQQLERLPRGAYAPTFAFHHDVQGEEAPGERVPLCLAGASPTSKAGGSNHGGSRRTPVVPWGRSVVSVAGALDRLGMCDGTDRADTLDTSPLAFLPVDGAGVDDQRGRFREILCAVDEAHGHELPEHRPCSDILHRFTDEPAGTSEPVHVGPAQLKLRVAVVAGLGAECFAGLVSAFPFALERLRGLGYQTASIRVDGLSSSTNNGRQVKDAVVAMDLAPAERLVLVGYSKGAPDILEGLVAYPEMGERVAAVVSIAGSVNGSPLADDASPSLLTLLEYLPGSQCDEGDGGAIDSLKPSIRRDFAKAHEVPRTVQYYSLSTFAQREQISFGLRGSYDELAEIDPRNDSQMLFYDQIIAGSALLGFVNADHWAVALPISRARPALATTVINRNEFPREMLLEAIIRHVEERLLAVPPRGFESASKPRGQA